MKLSIYLLSIVAGIFLSANLVFHISVLDSKVEFKIDLDFINTLSTKHQNCEPPLNKKKKDLFEFQQQSTSPMCSKTC